MQGRLVSLKAISEPVGSLESAYQVWITCSQTVYTMNDCSTDGLKAETQRLLATSGKKKGKGKGTKKSLKVII